MKDPNLLNGQNLAYIGDAYYELYIRQYLLEQGITKSNELKQASLAYVSAHAHTLIFKAIQDQLSEEEQNLFKRGRNSSNNSYRKNLNGSEHTISTGFEAIIGYHYLCGNQTRLAELMKMALASVQKGETPC